MVDPAALRPTEPATTVVSVTRFRARSPWLVPLFLVRAQGAIAQMRRSDGYRAGSLRRYRDGSFWTMTVWRDEAALRSYVTSGAHLKAMPRLAAWGREASTARWNQSGEGLPGWTEAERRMRDTGRVLPLPHGRGTGSLLHLPAAEPAHTVRL